MTKLPQKPAEGLGLQRLPVNRQEVIAQGALLLVTDQVGLQHLLSARRACHYERHGRRIAW